MSSARRLLDFWFAPADARDLAVVRVLLASILLVLSFWYQADTARWAQVTPWVWDPVLPFRWTRPEWFTVPLLTLLLWTWRASLFFLTIGLFTRTSAVVVAVTGFIVLGLPQNLGKVNHHYGLVALCLMILAVARPGDAWSVDRLRKIVRNATGPFRAEPDAEGPEYRWPLRLMQVMAVLVLFSAGVAKLRIAGPAWVWSDNLQNTMLRHFYTHQPMLNVGLWLAQHPLLSRFLAAGAVLTELSAPLLLVTRGWIRSMILAAVLGLLLGFGLVLGVMFLHLILTVLVLFVPWRALGAWVAARLPVRSFAVLYDGSCRLCRKTVGVMAAVDAMDRVEIRDALTEWPEISARWPSLDQLQCLESMHVVRSNGKVYDGFAGYRALAWAIPLWWPLLPLLYLPGVPRIGQAIYERVAAGRLKEGCAVPMAAGR